MSAVTDPYARPDVLRRGIGSVLHVQIDSNILCGAETTPLDTVTDDDLLCSLCMRQLNNDPASIDQSVYLELDEFVANRLAKLPYELYLRTSHWQKLRQLALDHYGQSCVLCNNGNIDVHHRTYDRIGKERLDDLIVLCRDCHRRHHAAP